MARLTLSEQVNAQASRIAELTADLHAVSQELATTQGSLSAQAADAQRMRALLDEVPKLREDLAKLTKERDDAKRTYEYRDKAADKAEGEIEQAHAVLDGVEGAPTRDYELEGSYGKRQRNVVTRLAGAFLAIAKNGGTK